MVNKPDVNQGYHRSFLLVVDFSSELGAALRFACRRALHTNGSVALFHAVEPSDFHHFASIAGLMETEARSEAEKLLQRVAADVQRLTGKMPSLFLREGDTNEQLLAVLDEQKDISVLVLGAGTGEEGPGPLVSALSGRLAGQITLPVTIVPGNLTTEEIDALT
ncbi:MAG: universal stress protein [Rhodospirillaceae bacterium]|jgi:nucleotide-binding universal stress UspA family protein|nr:universal stress protein [Rhodospirillaceae bacterium]